MKPMNHYLKYAGFGRSLLALLLAFSCSPEPDFEAYNLEAINAKSNKSVLKTLVKGASLKGANGLDVGPDGNLYVASVSGQNITVINKNSGKIINRITDEVESPDDLVFSPDGSAVYWTDIIIGEVGRMDMETGGVIKKFIAPGVNPIRFSEDGRLFVALDFLGDGLYELNPETLDIERHIISCPDGFGLGFFNSFDTRMENDKLMLYGPLFALNIVIAIDVDSFVETTEFPGDLSGLFAALTSGQIRIVAGSFPPPSDLFNPAAAKFGPDGMLYVLDQAGKFFKVNPDGQDDKSLISTLDPGLDNMTFDADGSLYMTNNDEGWVAEILLPSGQPRILTPGGIVNPQGLVVMEGPKNQDVLFEADLFNLRKFNGTNGQQLEQYKGFLIPEGPESLILPMNLSPDGDNLVITSWFSGAVQVWNTQDQSVETISYGIDGQQKIPIDAVRVNGDIYISDLALGGVVKQGESTPTVPLLASGLASDGETLYAADWGSGKIYKVDFDGGTIATTEIAQVAFPEGLALDQQGGLLVVETGTFSLLRIDLENDNAVTTLAEGLEFNNGGLGDAAPPTYFFDAVAVGPSGDIYITGGGSNVVYKISQNKVR
jgi:sugar lactone lactonase YvrE